MTHQDDLSADLVVLECERRGIEIFRFNTELFPISTALRYDPAYPRSAVLTVAGDDIGFQGLTGIWIRRPQWPQISTAVTDELDRALAQQESIAAIGGLWRLLAPLCVSPPDAIQSARWKTHQLWLAAQLGFSVPPSRVTNDPESAAAFLSQHGSVVLKAVQDGRVMVGERERAGLTTPIVEFEPADLESSPVLLQAAVPKTADLRLTLVGSRAFAVRIRTPKGAPLDFRGSAAHDCEYEVVEIPVGTLERCAQFLATYGLRYGAFDFGEEDDGGLWFFECNPVGQWGWIEGETGLPITASLVDLLCDPVSHR